MVKAPEKFLNEYMSRQKNPGGKQNKRYLRTPLHKVSEEALARLNQNLKTLWGIYGTPEIKEILSQKHRIHFLDIESIHACLSLSYVAKGVFMEYELDMGSKKELAGARIFKQAEMSLNRYFTFEKGTEELLQTTNEALQAIVDVLIDKELSETDIWNAIAKGEKIHLSSVSQFV